MQASATGFRCLKWTPVVGLTTRFRIHQVFMCLSLGVTKIQLLLMLHALVLSITKIQVFLILHALVPGGNRGG